MSELKPKALEKIRVLDLSEGRGLYAGRMLADFGADVIKIEPTDGSEARRLGPFKNDVPHREHSLYFIHFNMNKRGITLNLHTDAGKDIFKRLVKGTDVVIEDFNPGITASSRLDYDVLKAINNRLVMASVTGFGRHGPYRDYNAPDPINFAMSGHMYMSGESGKAPVIAPCDQVFHSTSATAVFSIIAALYRREKTGEGCHIDLSAHEVMTAINEELIMRYSIAFEIQGRFGSQHTSSPGRIYPCKDGYVYIIALRPLHWKSLLDILGNPDIFSDRAWDDPRFRRLNNDILDPIISEFTMKYTKADLTKMCQDRHIPCCPVNSPEDFTRDPHVASRGFIADMDHPAIGSHSYLKSPITMSETPCRMERSAPTLGQHNREIYMGDLGYKEEELAALQAEGII